MTATPGGNPDPYGAAYAHGQPPFGGADGSAYPRDEQATGQWEMQTGASPGAAWDVPAPPQESPQTASASVSYWSHFAQSGFGQAFIDPSATGDSSVRDSVSVSVDPPVGASSGYGVGSKPRGQPAYPSAPTEARADGESGSVFGPYLLQGELGRGGMGVVYMAYHRELRRHCAVKTLSLQTQDAEATDRFVREGQAAAKLGKHPNIVQVFDAGLVSGTPYIAMEFVVGSPLDKRLKTEGQIPVEETLELGRKVALALDHAHRCGIVHRDIKPANVIIDRSGEPQILDFGLAKDVTDTSQLSAAGSILGTPAYMPPEQAQPGLYPVDRRSDVYSLSATLFHCLAGEVPFRGESSVDTIVKVILEDPPSLSRRYGIDRDIEAIVEKGLEKDPARRYQTALELADDLSRVIAGEEPKVRPLGPLGRLWRRVRRNRSAVATMTLLGLAVLTLVGFLVYRTIERGRAIVRRNEAGEIVGSLYGNEGAEVRIHAYGRVVKEDPTWERAYFQLAVAYLDRALELDSDEELVQALAYRRRALETLDEGIARGLGAIGYYQRGNTYEEMRLRSPMLASFRRAASLDPDGAFGAKAAAAVALYEWRYADAERFATRALKATPDDDLTAWRRGEARLHLGHLDAAYADAVRAVDLWPQEPEYHLLAAQVALAGGKPARFGQHILGGWAVNPNHAEILAEMVGDAVWRGELDRASALSDASWAADAERPVAGDDDRTAATFVARARVRFARGEREGGLADLQRALVLGDTSNAARKGTDLARAGLATLDGLSGAALLKAGQTALLWGLVDVSLAAAERFLADDPQSAPAHELGARTLLLKGQPAGAAAFAPSARSPASEAVRAWCLWRAGQKALARTRAEAALGGTEQPRLALLVQAQARAEQEQVELALTDVERVLRDDPLDAAAVALRARLFDAIHDRDGAKDARSLARWLRGERSRDE